MAKVVTSNPDRTISLKTAVRKLKIILILILILIILIIIIIIIIIIGETSSLCCIKSNSIIGLDRP